MKYNTDPKLLKIYIVYIVLHKQKNCTVSEIIYSIQVVCRFMSRFRSSRFQCCLAVLVAACLCSVELLLEVVWV